MRRLDFHVNLEFDYGDVVYIVAGKNKKTWLKGVIKGWNIGYPGFPFGFDTREGNYRAENRWFEEDCSMPVTYIINAEVDGLKREFKRPSYSVFSKPGENEIERLNKLEEQKKKLEAEIARINSLYKEVLK